VTPKELRVMAGKDGIVFPELSQPRVHRLILACSNDFLALSKVLYDGTGALEPVHLECV